jgi:predicted phage tail protein
LVKAPRKTKELLKLSKTDLRKFKESRSRKSANTRPLKLEKFLEKEKEAAAAKEIIVAKEAIVQSEDLFLSDFLSIFLDAYISSGYLWSYSAYFFDKNVDKYDHKLVNLVLQDLGFFLDSIDKLVEKGNFDNIINNIKNTILKDSKVVSSYFQDDKVAYKQKNSYGVSIDEDSFFVMQDFFNQAEAKDEQGELIEKNKKILQKEFLFFAKNKLLKVDQTIKSGSFYLVANSDLIQYVDLVEYLNEVVNLIKNKEEGFFKTLLKSYFYFLFLENNIVSISELTKSVKQTSLKKENLNVKQNVEKIIEANKILEKFINQLWLLFKNQKNLNKDQIKFIEVVSKHGNLHNYLKKQIEANKVVKKTKLEKAKTVGKIVIGAAAIGGGVYAAGAILGGAAIAKSMGSALLTSSVGSYLTGFSYKMLDSWQGKDKAEKGYKLATTNFIGAGVSIVSGSLMQPVLGFLEDILPKTGVTGFIAGMGGRYIANEASSIITGAIARPIANAIGSELYNTSIYGYAKNKLKKYLDKKNIYLIYGLPKNISINDSLLISKIFKIQKRIEYMVVFAEQNESFNVKKLKGINEIEKLFFSQVEESISERDQNKKYLKLEESHKEREKAHKESILNAYHAGIMEGIETKL